MRTVLLAVLALSLAGCSSLEDVYRQAERASRTYDGRYGDRDRQDIRRDVDRYVREVDRAVRLDRRQERRITDLLEDRARRYERDRSRRDRYDRSPFPRRARADREVERFWRDADGRIERELDRRQRDRYRRWVRQFDDRRYRDRDDDDDWDDDDDDWDDDGR